MEQQSLFYERVEDALAAVIAACGGRKKFATEMFPDKSAADAHNLVNAMLNPERREKFSPDQLLYIARRGREVGCHAVMAYLARECSYREPEPLDPADQAAELQQRFIDAVGQLEAIQKQLQRVQQARVRAVG